MSTPAPGFVICKLEAPASGELPVVMWLTTEFEWTQDREKAHVWTTQRAAFISANEKGSGVVMETAQPIALPVRAVSPEQVFNDLEKRGLA